jgi:hypothetical protein
MSNYWDYDEPEYEPEPVLELEKEVEKLQAENAELKSKLDLAVKAMEFTVKNSGTSTNYNKMCALALKEIKES